MTEVGDQLLPQVGDRIVAINGVQPLGAVKGATLLLQAKDLTLSIVRS